VKAIEQMLKCRRVNVSKGLKELIRYAMHYAERTGGPQEPSGWQSLIQFLDDDVRYHLGCDAEQGLISNDAFSKLTAELDALIAGLRV